MRDNSVPVNPVTSDEKRKTPQECRARSCCLPCGPAKSTTGVKAKTSASPHSAPHLRGLDIPWCVTSSPPGGDAEWAAADGRYTTAGLAHGRHDEGTGGPSGDSSRKAPCPPTWWCYGLSFCASRRACSSARSFNSACKEALRRSVLPCFLAIWASTCASLSWISSEAFGARRRGTFLLK